MRLPGEENLDIQSFDKMLDLDYITNSYKLYWFSGIIDEIKLSNKEMNFIDVANV